MLKNLLLRRRDYHILIAQGGAWLIAALAGGLLPQLGVPAIITTALIVIGAICVLDVTAVQLSESNHTADAKVKSFQVAELRQRQGWCEDVINDLLVQTAKLVGKSGLTTRCCVFLPETPDRMHIAYHYNMVNAPDVGLRLAKYQGCTGHVWGTGKQSAADLGQVTPQDLEKTWKLNSEQIRLTEHLGSILSTPIVSHDKIVGILSIDSSGTLEESGFEETETQGVALQSAATLAQLLQIGELVREC